MIWNGSYKKHLYAQTAGFLEGWRGREGSSIKSKMPFLSLHTLSKKAPNSKKINTSPLEICVSGLYDIRDMP